VTAVVTIFAGGQANLGTGAFGLSYSPLDGYQPPVSTEANMQYEYLTAYTLNGLQGFAYGTLTGSSGTLKSRIGGANGNMLLTLSALTTTPQAFSDTTHTDSVASTNKVNLANSGNSSDGVTFSSTSVQTTSTGGVASWSADAGGTGSALAFTGATTQYLTPAGCFQKQTTESNAAYTVNSAGTWQALQIYITANTTAVASSIKSRVGLANGNQVLSPGAGATGFIIDTTHSDALTAGASQVDLSATPGDANTVTIQFVHSEVALSTTGYDVIANYPAATIAASVFYSVFGPYRTNGGNEISYQDWTNSPQTFSKMNVSISGSPGTTAIQNFRVNGANGNQTLSLGSAGLHTDTTHTDAVSATSLFAYGTSSFSGANNVNWAGVSSNLPSGVAKDGMLVGLGV
jgi:hypothetical protein